MSDSQSDGIPAGLGNLEGSKESVSTENDTEADIEEMSSIADYEAPFAPGMVTIFIFPQNCDCQ